MDAIEVDERDAEDGERPVVRRVLAVGRTVVGGERVAVECCLQADALADTCIPRVGHREEHGVPEEQRRQVDRAARRVAYRQRSHRRERRSLVLGDRDGGGKPHERRRIVILQSMQLGGKPGERGAVARQRRGDQPFSGIVHCGEHREPPHPFEGTRADVRASCGPGGSVATTWLPRCPTSGRSVAAIALTWLFPLS